MIVVFKAVLPFAIVIAATGIGLPIVDVLLGYDNQGSGQAVHDAALMFAGGALALGVGMARRLFSAGPE